MEEIEPLWRAESVGADGKITDLLMPFSPEEFKERLARIRKQMQKHDLEVLVFTAPESIYYLTNYQTPGNPPTFLVVPLDEAGTPCLLTRELEGSNMRFRSMYPYYVYDEGEAPEFAVAKQMLKVARRTGSGVLFGFEGSSPRLTVKSQRALEAQLKQLSADGGCPEWFDATELMLELRNIKSQQEIKYATNAAAYTLAGIRAAVKAYTPGVTEVKVAGSVLKAMGEAGHEYASYPIFLCFGNAGDMAHHAASRRKLSEGELVFIEVGGCCHRYHASKMHTVWIGSTPPDWYLEAEALLKEATAAGRAACVAGAVGKDVDTAMRSVLSRLTVPHWMSTRSAYAIGTGLATDWAEKNILCDPTATCVLQANMTLHLVPWIQIEGKGSMGFSDTVLVHESGPATSLFEAEPPRLYEGATSATAAVTTGDASTAAATTPLKCGFSEGEWAEMYKALTPQEVVARISERCGLSGVPAVEEEARRSDAPTPTGTIRVPIPSSSGSLFPSTDSLRSAAGTQFNGSSDNLEGLMFGSFPSSSLSSSTDELPSFDPASPSASPRTSFSVPSSSTPASDKKKGKMVWTVEVK